jgi:hypothetical protein
MRKFFLLFAVVLLSVSSVSAVNLCTDEFGTNVLLTPGFSCELGGLTFSNFGASTIGGELDAAISLAEGLVTDPWQKQTGVFGNVVNLFFQTNFNQNPDIFRDILFGFDVTGGLIGVDAWMGGQGHRSISETVCADELCQTVLGELLLDSDLGIITTSVPLSGTASIYHVSKNISLFGETGSPATMSEFSQSFETPEPLTFGLIGSGLLLLGLLRRRAR